MVIGSVVSFRRCVIRQQLDRVIEMHPIAVGDLLKRRHFGHLFQNNLKNPLIYLYIRRSWVK